MSQSTSVSRAAPTFACPTASPRIHLGAEARTRAVARIERLLAIDDVGAGFSSMAHVLQLRANVLKLDRALVAGIDGDAGRQALVRSLVAFAAEIGASVTAEGIEREAEAASLRALKVGFGQGFHFGRPGLLGESISSSDLPARTERAAAESCRLAG